MEKYANDINDGMSRGFFDSVQNEYKLNDKEKRAYDSKYYSTAKVIVSGHIIEVYNYEFPVKYGTRSSKEQVPYHESTHDVDPETGEIRRKDYCYDPEAARQANSRRAKNNLRRVLISNFDNRSTFITLTFRDGSVNDVTCVKECNGKFDSFMKRLRRRYGSDFKYCWVIEFQDKNGRGAVHYHVVADLPYVPYDKLGEIWGNGFIGINRIDHVDNVGAYITKYMTKDSNDPRLQGEKSYNTSKNMTRPIELFGSEAHEIIDKYILDKKRVFTNSYESEHQGKITYTEYNLKRYFGKDGG